MASTINRLLGREDEIKKGLSVILQFAEQPESLPREPDVALVKLYEKAERDCRLQQIFRVIMQEVLRPGWSTPARFKSRCTTCGYMLPTKQEKCSICGGTTLLPPDGRQLVLTEALIRKPNSSRQTWTDIINSLVYHDLVADEYYLSVAFAEVLETMLDDDGTKKFRKTGDWKPKEIYVEHPAHLKTVMDERGRLGANKYFCPACDYEGRESVKEKPFKCRRHHKPAIKVVYEQHVNGEVKANFGINQVAHGSTHRVLPYPFGRPRMASLWEIIWTLSAMDNFFFDTYQTGKVSKLINFPEYDPEEVADLAVQMRAAEAKMDAIDAQTGQTRTNRRVRNVMIGSQSPIQVFDTFPDPSKMQSLDYYMLGIQIMCGVYGVQPIMIAFIEKGKAGTTPFMQIEVNNRTIEEYQQSIEEVINTQLFPIFGITDYIFKFNPMEKKDTLREANINLLRARTVLTWRQAGFNVDIDEEGRVKVSGGGSGPMPGRERPDGETPREGEKESDRSGALINETTVQRHDKESPTGMVV